MSLLAYFFLVSAIGFSQNSQTQFQEANNLYQSKRFGKAIDIYEAILAQGERSAELCFNLGNAYFRSGSLGKAILNFERALIQNPNMEDARYNLEVANKNQKDELETLEPFFLKQWWQKTRSLFSEAVWTTLGLLFLWSGIGGLIMWLFGTERTQKKKGFFAGLVLVLLSILPFSLASSRAQFDAHTNRAILISSSISLKSGPDQASTEIITIHEGLKLELLDKIGEWHKVKLSNGEQGWLPEGVFEEI